MTDTEKKVVRPAAFRQPAQGYVVELKPGKSCDVHTPECVGLDEHGLCVLDASAGREFWFCAVHALAAEALVTYSGFRGQVVPMLLQRLHGVRWPKCSDCGHASHEAFCLEAGCPCAR